MLGAEDLIDSYSAVQRDSVALKQIGNNLACDRPGRPRQGLGFEFDEVNVDTHRGQARFALERQTLEEQMAVAPSDNYQDWRVYSEQQISRILAAALETFSAKGYHGTSTRQLAQQSGLSVPGIYHHYRSKQDILFDLMMVVIDESIERCRNALKEAGPSPAEQFDAMVESLLRFHMHRQRGAVLSANELPNLTPEQRAFYIARRDELQRMLDVIVADGVQSGDFLASYPADASRAITSLCLGVAVWYVAQGELPEDEFLVRYQVIARSIVVARHLSADRREGGPQWGG